MEGMDIDELWFVIILCVCVYDTARRFRDAWCAISGKEVFADFKRRPKRSGVSILV